MTSTDLLLVGATGFIGRALLPVLAADRTVTAVRFESPEPPDTGVEWLRLDLEDLAEALEDLRPAAIVNAAALAAPAACGADPALARRLNVDLPAVLAGSNARLIHLSTDQVFDGQCGGYVELDAPNPVSVYGETKLAGERTVRDRSPSAVVLRVNLVCGRSSGPRMSSVDVMLAAAAAGDKIPLFTDEFRSPVAMSDVVRAVAGLVEADFRGILHLGGPRLSRLELGRPILEKHGLADRIRPMSLADYAGPPRAPDTSFDSSLAARVLGITPRGIDKIVELC
ncbi:MAG: sugar nucleotide-binding protein [Planctomycetota bacterium]